MAAVRRLEDEPSLNAGIGATLNQDGDVELDAGVMDGDGLRAGAVGAVRDARHPIDLARAVMDDGRHVLLVAEGASRFAREHGVETCDPATFVTERQRRNLELSVADTVGAVARDDRGHLAAAVSTGGMTGKLQGRLGDSPIVGAGFYADDALGAAVGTGQGEGFIRIALCHLAVLCLAQGYPVERAAQTCLEHLQRQVGMTGGVILMDAKGGLTVAHNTAFMAWAQKSG